MTYLAILSILFALNLPSDDTVLNSTSGKRIMVYYEVQDGSTDMAAFFDGAVLDLVNFKGDTLRAWVEHHRPGIGTTYQKIQPEGVELFVSCYPTALPDSIRQIAVFPNWPKTIWWVSMPHSNIVIFAKTEKDIALAYRIFKTNRVPERKPRLNSWGRRADP